MALVSNKNDGDSLSSLSKAADLQRSIDRANDLRRKNIIEYEARKRAGQIPLENLIEIHKRGNEQCS